MAYDKELLSHKLQRWDGFIERYRLPEWEAIPNFGLYMDQVIVLLQQYLYFIPAPSEGKDSFVTSSTINNYVRLKIMPAPVKKKYGRVHIAYLIMILTLKLSLSISDVQRLLPPQLTEAEVQTLYRDYQDKFRHTQQQFCGQLRAAAEEFAAPESADAAAGRLVIECALSAGFHTLLAQKLIHLDGADTAAVLAAEGDGAN